MFDVDAPLGFNWRITGMKIWEKFSALPAYATRADTQSPYPGITEVHRAAGRSATRSVSRPPAPNHSANSCPLRREAIGNTASGRPLSQRANIRSARGLRLKREAIFRTANPLPFNQRAIIRTENGLPTRREAVCRLANSLKTSQLDKNCGKMPPTTRLGVALLPVSIGQLTTTNK